MKKIDLNKGWSLSQIKGEETGGRVFFIEQIPCQVHDILIREGVIENPNIRGVNHNQWIGKSEWRYEKQFFLDNIDGEWNLVMEGLDTFADVYINGKFIIRNETVYMANKVIRVQGLKKGENTIRLDFKSPFDVLENIKLPEEYAQYVPEFCKGRVFRSGFYSFSGPLPDLVRMGIYGNIWLEQVQDNGFLDVSACVKLKENEKIGEAVLEISYCREETTNEILKYIVKDCQGNIVKSGAKKAGKTLKIEVENPELWWPRIHGSQSIYTVDVELLFGDKILDTCTKKIGFRNIQQKGELDFYVNGKPIKLLGVNLTQVDTVSGCYHRQKMNELLSLAEMANCNCIRVWGESEVLPDEFYEECDKRGILVWQDFYIGYNMYNVEPNMLKLYEKEAIWLVNRLKHHPCILLWCGGNEVLLARDYQYPGVYCYGEEIFKEIYPAVCQKLDADRYYHSNCPSGGAYANDPSHGDSHGYTHQWYVPNVKYPVFLSENARFSPPSLRTMKRMLTEEELWPKNYNGKVTKDQKLPWPVSWEEHCCGETGQRLGPVENYYDADDAESLIYKIGAAYCEYVKKDVERVRRGKPDYMPQGERKTKGHILWKLNNCSNLISYGVIDYFNEPQMVYYALKRAYEPFQISFSLENQIGLWAVNDTPETKKGSVCVSVFDLPQNKVIKQMQIPFLVSPDESQLLTFLDDLGQIKKECILIAEAIDEEQRQIAWNLEYLDIERHLDFPEDSGIAVKEENGELVLKAERFARSVEILGNEDGDEFGWLFSDNYFDLLPGEEKRVKILGKHKKGTITVKPYYDKTSVTLNLND